MSGVPDFLSSAIRASFGWIVSSLNEAARRRVP
jgi:hypothetical protein